LWTGRIDLVILTTLFEVKGLCEMLVLLTSGYCFGFGKQGLITAIVKLNLSEVK
jgi:hypothetical protein